MRVSTEFASTVSFTGLEALHRLLAYRNVSVLRRYKEDSGVSDERAEVDWTAFLQFMAVCMFQSERVTATPAADGVWHAFLLHTKQYAAFCEEFLGGFVHHDPTSDEGSPEDYQRSRGHAQTMFGNLDERGWPNILGRIKCFSARGPEDIRRFS